MTTTTPTPTETPSRSRGTGTTALIHAPRVARIDAIDFSRKMIAIAREKAERQGVSNVHFDVAAFEDWPIPDDEDRYDAVLGMSVLHLVADLDSTLARVRQVVRPADVLMYIVPQEQPLVITAQIPTVHIDQIHVGQPATLHFSSFDRRTPSLNGQVTKVSADAFTDENTGRSYYTAELLLSDGEVDRLQGLELLPGMPAEAFIKTGERTPLNYLLKPLTDYFNRAFRET